MDYFNPVYRYLHLRSMDYLYTYTYPRKRRTTKSQISLSLSLSLYIYIYIPLVGFGIVSLIWGLHTRRKELDNEGKLISSDSVGRYRSDSYAKLCLDPPPNIRQDWPPSLSLSIYIYIYIYMCVCVLITTLVIVCWQNRWKRPNVLVIRKVGSGLVMLVCKTLTCKCAVLNTSGRPTPYNSLWKKAPVPLHFILWFVSFLRTGFLSSPRLVKKQRSGECKRF